MVYYLDEGESEVYDEMRAKKRAERLAAQESTGSRLYRIYKQVGQIATAYPNIPKFGPTYKLAHRDNDRIKRNLSEIDRINDLRNRNEDALGYNREVARGIEMELGSRILKLETEITQIKTTRTTADDLDRKPSEIDIAPGLPLRMR